MHPIHRSVGSGRSVSGGGTRASALRRGRRRSLLVVSIRMALALLAPSLLAGQQSPASLSGTVVDGATLEPVSDVIVRIEGMRVAATTGLDGRFRIDVAPGNHRLLVEHLAYGEHSESVEVKPGARSQVEIRISERAIELEPIVVETMTELDRRRLTSGTRMKEILRQEIDNAARRGLSMAELLRQGMPNLSVRGNCVEYRGARRGGRQCREVHAIMDGVPVSSPSMLVATMPLQDIERLEVLSPAEAGARYGTLSGYGVLLIETRRGPERERTPREQAEMAALDWSLEAKPYNWKRVMASSFAGNAIGLAVGMALGDLCLRVSDTGFAGVRTKCDPLMTMGASFMIMGLPGLAGGTAARWAGATERSQGRLVPSAILSTVAVASGYLIWMQGTRVHSGATRAAGMVVLMIGTPVISAFSDRIFRSLR